MKEEKKIYDQLTYLKDKGKLEELGRIFLNLENAEMAFYLSEGDKLIVMDQDFLHIFKRSLEHTDDADIQLIVARLHEIEAKTQK